MINLLDSGWLAAIRKVEWWRLAAIAVTSAVIFALDYFDAPWFGQLPLTPALVIGVLGVLSFCLIVFRMIDLACQSVKEFLHRRLRRSFNQLSEKQRELLLIIFQRGSRRFVLRAGIGASRWIEELENWRYIEQRSFYISDADTPIEYKITESGWQQLEKHQGKSN